MGLRNFLLKAPDAAKPECKAYLRGFLCSLLLNMAQEIIEISKTTSSMDVDEDKLVDEDMDEDVGMDNKKMGYSDLTQAFFSLFDNEEQRNSFYDKVVVMANPTEDPAILQNAASNLQTTLNDHYKDAPSKGYSFIMALDEVHVLYEPRPQDFGTTHNLFSLLKSVLSDIVGWNFCVVALSTTTSITAIAPSKEVAPSLRERTAKMNPPAPFTELPFDAFLINEPLQDNMVTMSSVGTLKFTAKFGRPLLVAITPFFIYAYLLHI